MDGELVVATLHNLVVPCSAQHINDIAQTEAFSSPGDSGEQLLRIRRAILQRWRIYGSQTTSAQAVITRATRLTAICFAEVSEERTPSAGRSGAVCHHLVVLAARKSLPLGISHLGNE